MASHCAPRRGSIAVHTQCSPDSSPSRCRLAYTLPPLHSHTEPRAGSFTSRRSQHPGSFRQQPLHPFPHSLQGLCFTHLPGPLSCRLVGIHALAPTMVVPPGVLQWWPGPQALRVLLSPLLSSPLHWSALGNPTYIFKFLCKQIGFLTHHFHMPSIIDATLLPDHVDFWLRHGASRNPST